MNGFAPKVLSWAGAALISIVGLIHLLLVGEHFEAAIYLGLLFLANFGGAVVAALGIYLGSYRWAWLLGVLVAGGAFVGFIVSRTVGLPGASRFVGEWYYVDAYITMIFELPFLVLSLLALTPQGRVLLRAEEDRVKRERMAPAWQETPEHSEEIEKEMADIRSRIAPDLSDLRKHAEPRVVKERVGQVLRGRLHGALSKSSMAPITGAAESPRRLAALAALGVAAVLVARRASGGSDR